MTLFVVAASGAHLSIPPLTSTAMANSGTDGTDTGLSVPT